MDDFRYMMLKNVKALTQTEIRKLTNIRNALPKPDRNTLMQKVVSKHSIEIYLREQGPRATIRGHISRASDAKHLESFDDLYHSLRLDYKDTNFFLEDDYCYAIRFKTNDTDVLEIPRENNIGYPFTATGFTAGNEGRLGVPEWLVKQVNGVKKRVEIDEGAEIWKIDNNGHETLFATLKETNGVKRFIKVIKE